MVGGQPADDLNGDESRNVPAYSDSCDDCGLPAVHAGDEATRCPACFERHLYTIDVGFLDSYRKFGARSRLIVAETCMRGLVLAAPEHRKILAMQIFEEYVLSMSDLAGLFTALMNRRNAPIMKTFMEFRLNETNATEFFEAIQSVNDFELVRALGLPATNEVAAACPHLDEEDAYQLAVSIYQLLQELRKVTDPGGSGALALAQVAGAMRGAIVASDTSWLEGARALPPGPGGDGDHGWKAAQHSRTGHFGRRAHDGPRRRRDRHCDAGVLELDLLLPPDQRSVTRPTVLLAAAIAVLVLACSTAESPAANGRPAAANPELDVSLRSLGAGSADIALDPGQVRDLDPLSLAINLGVTPPACADFVLSFTWQVRLPDPPGDAKVAFSGERMGGRFEVAPSGELRARDHRMRAAAGH